MAGDWFVTTNQSWDELEGVFQIDSEANSCFHKQVPGTEAPQDLHQIPITTYPFSKQ
jgi:hypothetical protein